MNAFFKKMFLMSLLLLSGCVHHPGFFPVRPYHGSYDISFGTHIYKDRHHDYKSRGYFPKWRSFYSDRHDHDYHSDYKYRGENHNGRRYKDKHNHKYQYHDNNRYEKKHFRGKKRRDR